MTRPEARQTNDWTGRVVFACPRIPELGGGGTATEALSRSLVQRGVDVSHVTLSPGIRPPVVPTTTVFEMGDAHRTPSFRGTRGVRSRARGAVTALLKRRDRRRGLRRLRRIVEALGAHDVVVFTNLLPKIALDESGYRRSASSPIFIGQHHSTFHGEGSEWERGPKMRHFDDLDLFLALTDEDAQLFQTVVKAPCASVPNIAPAMEHNRHRPGHTVVALARYEREKRLDLMIESFATATLHEHRDWQLHLYGDGSLRSQLEGQIKRLKIDDRVHLMGRTDDVEEVMRTAALHLLTSEFEGFPMSVLEASAMGVPTIAFDCSPGVRALVSDKSGALVAPGELAAFSVELERLIADDQLRGRLGSAALEVAAAYSGDVIVDRWLSFIHDCDRRRREPITLAKGAGASS
jgi:glycosyltransferase involved in cell wall biosynthesis